MTIVANRDVDTYRRAAQKHIDLRGTICVTVTMDWDLHEKMLSKLGSRTRNLWIREAVKEKILRETNGS